MANGFTGFIDVASPNGFFEGWALSDKSPFDTVSVCILWREKPLGAGVANLFRPDLLALGIGHGWHGFRLRIDEPFKLSRELRLLLVEIKTGAVITTAKLTCPKVFNSKPLDVDSLVNDRDVEVTDINSLSLTEPVIVSFMNTFGVEAFVNYGYCYILGRSADPEGCATYAKQIASGALAPLTFLSILFNSAERRQRNWTVLAPSDPGFPFAPKQPE